MRKRLIFLVLLSLIYLNCEKPKPVIPPAYQAWQMRMEYDCQSSAEPFEYDIFASYSELDEYLKGAFEPCSTWIWSEWDQTFEVDTFYFTSDSLLRDDKKVKFYMDFDTTNNHPERTYEHMGVMWGGLPEMLSAVAIYRDPFRFKAGIHTVQEYNIALAAEFPGRNYEVHDTKYIRLPE